jgi:hypothetical protein
MDPLMLPILILSSAFATGIRFDEIPCPFGEGTTRRYQKVSANSFGGYDSDLATYSTRGQFRTHAVSTCPDNYYSALGSSLDRTIPAEKHSQIQVAIDSSRSTWNQRDEPTVWERYDTAARIAIALDDGPLDIAELYLNASWTARDQAVGVYVGGLDGPIAARKILNLGEVELQKDLVPESKAVLLYNLARVAHRGGFISDRDEHLRAFLSLPSLSEAERAAGAKLKTLSQVIEPKYQDLAMSFLQAGIKQPGDPLRLARAQYQLADLSRRRGKIEQARDGYRKGASSPEAPDQLQSMAKFLLGEIGN